MVPMISNSNELCMQLGRPVVRIEQHDVLPGEACNLILIITNQRASLYNNIVNKCFPLSTDKVIQGSRYRIL